MVAVVALVDVADVVTALLETLELVLEAREVEATALDDAIFDDQWTVCTQKET